MSAPVAAFNPIDRARRGLGKEERAVDSLRVGGGAQITFVNSRVPFPRKKTGGFESRPVKRSYSPPFAATASAFSLASRSSPVS